VHARRPTDVRAVLFDFDETLVTLAADWPLIRHRVQKLAREYGIDAEPVAVIQGVVQVRDLLMNHPEAGIDALAATSFLKRAYGIIAEEEWVGLTGARVMDLGPEIIQTCYDWKKKVAVVSSNSHRVIVEALEKFGFPPIPTIVSRDDVDEVKPDPEPILTALQLLKVQPAHAIYVGNLDHDADAAFAAGVYPILLEVDSPWRGPLESPCAKVRDLHGIMEYL